MATVDLLRAMMLVAAAAVSAGASSAGSGAGSASCTTALEALCGGQRHASAQACAVCCGRHQQPLMQAACSRADCGAFCAAGGGGGPPADPGYDHQTQPYAAAGLITHGGPGGPIGLLGTSSRTPWTLSTGSPDSR